MAIFKCKMCGGDLEVAEGVNITECEYCGTKQTVPTADNEKKVNLFNRANRLRIGGEFDKAAAIYESIVAEFPEEAEAYWGLCLCNYGIEYVDDPATAKKIPTCHRASFESLQKDENFSLALEYADVVAQKVYRDEAREIDRIMSEILAVSKSEKPYDVFICYKETDEKGERTIDSVLAQDIYDALTAKGLKVFFARITLEDKLGKQYEPYIFAALNSAKVMLAIGSKYEYYHAVWVKNEWSRFLKLMAKDKSKVLIPCFKDIDAYDMPAEFKGLQAQDLGKLGAVQDLVRGIEKIIPKTEGSNTTEKVVVSQSGGPNFEALLKRGNMALEDKEWDAAKEFFDQALNINAECAEAYLGLAMTDEKVCLTRDLVFKNNLNSKNYRRTKQFADRALLDEILSYEKELQKDLIETSDRLSKIRNRIKSFSGLIAASSECTIGVQSDGAVVVTDYTSDNEDYINEFKCQHDFCEWSDIIAVSEGVWNTIGLKSDGTVVAVGDNANGRCNVCDWRDIIAVSAGTNYTVGVKSDGKVVTAGFAKWAKCDVTDWINIVAVASGEGHIVGLKSDGTVVATGCNDNGQCNTSEWDNIVSIATGYYITVGLKSDGTIVATGDISTASETKKWTDIVAVSTDLSTAGNIIGLKSDGTVVAVGYNSYGQCDVNGWTDIVAISNSYKHTIGLKSDGTVVATNYKGDEEENYGQCNVQKWKLFDDLDNLEEERKVKTKERSERIKEAESLKKNEIYSDAEHMAASNNIGDIEAAIAFFESISEWKDSVEKIRLCKEKIEAIQSEKKRKAEERKIAEEKRVAEEKRIAEEKKRIEEQKVAYRQKGLCQHCGGTFKGLFTKKCSACGKEKDY